MYKHHGFIAIEIIVSAVIGIVIVTVLLQMYQIIQTNNHYALGLNKTLHVAQNALDRLTKEIGMAGYVGCRRVNKDFSVLPAYDLSLTEENRLVMHDTEVTSRHASSDHVVLVEPMHNLAHIDTTKNLYFNRGEVLIISDCSQAELFIVGKVNRKSQSQHIVPEKPFRHVYSHAEISYFEVNHLYLSGSNLFVQDVKLRKHLLLGDINKLKIDKNKVVIQVASAPTWYAYVAV